jgi:hypothetical protein
MDAGQTTKKKDYNSRILVNMGNGNVNPWVGKKEQK